MLHKYNSFLFEQAKQEFYLLLEDNLVTSAEFLRKVKTIAKGKDRSSKIAEFLLNYIENDKYIQSDLKQNYFDVTDKDDTVSFLPTNKLPDDWDEEQNPSLPFNTKGRSEIKVGKLIKQFFKILSSDDPDIDFKDKDIEEFVNKYKSTKLDTKLEFKVVKGQDIAKYYDQKRYYSSTGSLGGSCMADESKSTFKIYSENEDKVRMLILVDKNDKITGRALVWKLKDSPVDSKIFMDRVYCNSDSDVYKFRNFADEKGWIQKKTMNSHIDTNVDFIFKGKEFSAELSVSVEGDFKSYPFIDTMCFLSSDLKELSNVPKEGCYFLHSVTGDCEKCDNCRGNIIDCWDCGNEPDLPCDDCNGSGDSDSGKCVTCKGKGKVKCEKCQAKKLNLDLLCRDCAEGLSVLISKGVENTFGKTHKFK